MILIQTVEDVIIVLIYMGIGIAWGAGSVYIIRWSRNLGQFFIIRVWQYRNGAYYLLKELKKKLSAETFELSDYQYKIEPEATSFYNASHPILDYELENSRPMVVKKETQKGPGSRVLEKFVKRQWLKQMIMATRGFDLKAAIPLMIFAAVLGLAIGAVLMQQWHPGLVPQPPSGYTYKVEPIPANATVVH